MIVAGNIDRYTVGTRVADAEKYRLYLCTQDKTGRQCLLQIATDVTHNGALSRTAYLLRELKRIADVLEEEYATVRASPNSYLNYDFGFPELVESFPCESQGGRLMNILAFRGVDDVSTMVPLRNISHRDKQRVDLRTSAWIMGKCLKLLVFAHSQGIAVGRLDNANILIQPEQHFVVFYDWSEAHLYPERVPREIASAEIAQAARAAMTAIGADATTRTFPDTSEETTRYRDFLLALADGKVSDTKQAHEQFYALIDTIWEHAFYPYTSFPVHEKE